MFRILLIEDEYGVGDVVTAYLSRTGRKVEWVRSFADGAAALKERTHDLLLIDIRLPDGSGLDLVERLRDAGDKRPIIIISAQDQIRDRISGLNAGADDYIVKPFNLGEMEARIDALQRRLAGDPSPKITAGLARIDIARQRAWLNDQEVDLSKTDWLLLRRLCMPAGQTVPKRALQDLLFAESSKDASSEGSNAVEVYISRLRRKLGADVILNKRGVGYRLAV